MGLCVVFFFLLVFCKIVVTTSAVSVLLISAKHSFPSQGCRWCHLPFRVFVVSSSNPRHANGPRQYFGMTSPLYQRL